MVGLWLGGGVDEGSELLVWVRAVATAILAGVIAQILVHPPGALASVPDWLRYGAVAAGSAAFIVTRRSIFAGVACGELVMLAGKWWLGSIGVCNSERTGENGMRSLARSALTSCLVIRGGGCRYAAECKRLGVSDASDKARCPLCCAAGQPTSSGRLVGEYLGRDLKQAVIVENKAGAEGAIGAEAVARSEPDGYTLFVTAASIFVLNPHAV